MANPDNGGFVGLHRRKPEARALVAMVVGFGQQQRVNSVDFTYAG
jgi:hypothetical protein